MAFHLGVSRSPKIIMTMSAYTTIGNVAGDIIIIGLIAKFLVGDVFNSIENA